jgi:L-asparaginase II
MPALSGGAVLVAEVVRSGFVEARHRGSVLAVAPDGSDVVVRGDVDVPLFPRSCNKPLQAVAMLRQGLRLDPHLLALATASHSGEEMHLAGVRGILAGVGLDERALQTPPDWPLDDTAREAAVRARADRSPIFMNCSGKHAAMLATCVVNGWDTGSYLLPEHPLQRGIAETIAELTGGPIAAEGIDGCGAPLLSASLRGLATAFARLATADEDSLDGAVATAIRNHPEMVSGTRRDEAALLRALPGAIAKAGAEASYVLALRDGTAVAVKIEDGGARARPVVMAATLQLLGLEHAVLAEQSTVVVLGGGRAVGEVNAVLSQPNDV